MEGDHERWRLLHTDPAADGDRCISMLLRDQAPSAIKIRLAPDGARKTRPRLTLEPAGNVNIAMI
jgi:hypothetical protein